MARCGKCEDREILGGLFLCFGGDCHLAWTESPLLWWRLSFSLDRVTSTTLDPRGWQLDPRGQQFAFSVQSRGGDYMELPKEWFLLESLIS